jgi:HlyD family secretion protein
VNVSASGTAASGLSKDIIAQSSVTLGSFSVKTGDVVKSGQSLGVLQDQNSDQNLLKAKNTLAQDNLKLTQLKQSLNALTVTAPVAGTIMEVNGSLGDDAGSIAKTLGKQSLIVIQYADAQGKTTMANINGNGVISAVNVAVGTVVNKGDILFRLKADDINNSIASQQINIQQDQDNLNNAQKQVDFNKMMSPIDGTVAALDFNPGDSIQAGKTIATIIDLTQMQTVVAVDELDIDKVKVGQKASITVDALTGKAFTGQVLKISSLGKTTNSVTTYDVTISIDKADGIKTGMTTNVSIAVQSKENVIMLPIESVQGTGNMKMVTVQNDATSNETSGTAPSSNGNAGNKGYSSNGGNTGYGNSSGSRTGRGGASSGANGFTIKLDTNEVTRKRVETGISNQTYIEVTSGVKEGDTVLVKVVTASSSSSSSNSNRSLLNGAGGGFGGAGGFTGGGTGGGGFRGN